MFAWIMNVIFQAPFKFMLLTKKLLYWYFTFSFFKLWNAR